ncbi:MAG: ATP-grasp domain-containing protein, partial [Candidatus Njordarchaeales archaeon]
VNGIFCHGVEMPHIISKAAEKLGLPALNPESAEIATNKAKRITQLSRNKIPCAKFQIVNNPEEIIEKSKIIGFPLIIKPIDNAGARGVRVVKCKDELIDSYNIAMKYSKTTTVLLEELLAGPEVSTESVVYNSKIYTFAFADRNYEHREIFYPYFVENGINFPTILCKKLQNAIYELVEKTIKVIGIDFGAAKGDIIIDRGQPKIIEMAARTSGGWFGAGSIPIATGSNMLKPLIQMAVGDEPDLKSLKPLRKLGCAQRYIIPIQEGVVSKITGVETARNMPGVKMFTMFLPQIGTKIRKATNHAERFGQIITIGKTREEAIFRCENAIKQIKIHLNSQ